MPINSVKTGIISNHNNIQLNKQANVSFQSKPVNNLERTPQEDVVEKKGLSKGAKIALGTVATAAALALIDQFAFKGKYRKKIFDRFKGATGTDGKGDVTNPPTPKPTGPLGAKDVITKKGLTYNKDGSLYTGEVLRASKSGSQLKTTYKDGVVVKREFLPSDKSKVQKIVKTYDTTTHEGLKLAKAEITKADGKIEHNIKGYFTEHQFAPEVESKIKMKDFDNLQAGDYARGNHDLGDGVSLLVGENTYAIFKGSKMLRHKSVSKSKDFVAISDSTNSINRNLSDNKYNFCTALDKVGNEYQYYYDEGSYNLRKYYDDAGNKLKKEIIEEYDALGKLIGRRTL